MPVLGIQTVATARNGVAAFIRACTSLSLHYCDWAGSSRGLNAYLRSPHLTRTTSSNPSVEFLIAPRPNKHPVIKASYINGRQKAICVKNLRPEEIQDKVELLLGNDGRKNRLVKGKKVESVNEGVRGGWSALHGGLKKI